MSEEYAREILRRNVAQICQTIGWNGINSTPLDILVHVLEKYIRTLGTQANRFAEQFNRTEPNLHDLGLVFRDLHIQLPELAEYAQSVPPVPPPVRTEKFPRPKESNLNFLKPGSHEVVTRPMHVHEHLPPMYPEKERETPAVAGTVEIRQNGIDAMEANNTCTSPEISVTDSPEKSKDIFKRPIDPVLLPNNKRPRLRADEEERTREISSVMMTMSGFLSPAREGKLPEARAPIIVSERHDKHKANSHHSNAMKVPMLDKSDKKSKKNKLLNGKIMKSKRKDKSHKGESSKSRDSNKMDRHPPGYPIKSKDVHPTHHNHVRMPAPRMIPPVKHSNPSILSSHPPIPSSHPPIPSSHPHIQSSHPHIPSSHSPVPSPVAPLPSPVPVIPVPEPLRPVIKQEPIDPPPPPLPPPPIAKPPPRIAEDAIPVPKKIPISKSPLVSNSLPVHKPQPTTNSLYPDVEIKKEVVEQEEKLASQPDRSKSNIFKRISNKSKEDKSTPEVVPEKSHLPDAVISRIQNSTPESKSENIRVKTVESIMNNNNSPVDLSREIDIRSHEVINIDDDSLDMHPNPMQQFRTIQPEPRPTPGGLSINKSLQYPFSKDLAGVSPKTKKERKHKEKKDKASKIEAKLKKQQQQLQNLQSFQMMQMAEKKKMKMGNEKPPKQNRPKNEAKLSQMPPGFPFFPTMPHGRGMMSGPGLIPSDLFANLANNPALRGLPPPNLLTNPFALGSSGPGLIPGPSFLPGGLGPGIPNHLMQMGNFPHTSRSSSVKFPQMLRRPSLEVIPVDNEEERIIHKSPMIGRDKIRHDKHKSTTIPNILQKHKPKDKEHKANLYKMPPVQPDITIELNPPKMEPAPRPVRPEPRREPPREPPPPVRLPSPRIEVPAPKPEPVLVPKLEPVPAAAPNPEIPLEKEPENPEKKKDKSHKKEKRDKDGLKIKKKKDKKDKNKDKSEKKKEKEERHELKDKIKKEKKEKKKEKSADGLVPKLTLKLSSSNSNSPMPPSSPDIFKLNIKPVVKKEEEDASSLKDEPTSRDHSRSPELAQISALVTRPPKQKHPKQNHITDAEAPLSSPASSPPRRNRPPSSHSKLKKILFKPMSKKTQVDDLGEEDVSFSDNPEPVPAAALAPVATDKPSGPLPTPYYVDDQGNKIWVCPACGRPDNGSPMIGCDGCDGWYHWVCVGITEEPGATEDWFCKSCLAKRAAMVLAGGVTSAKKRGRKPKGEKIRDCH